VNLPFITDLALSSVTWQGFERLVVRLLLSTGYQSIQLIGASGDEGADVVANRGDRRWLFQVKRWTGLIGPDVVARTVQACARYSAEVPVVVARGAFSPAAFQLQAKLSREGIPVQLWDRSVLLRMVAKLEDRSIAELTPADYTLRKYQELAVERILEQWLGDSSGCALIVLATGLGKTRVAAETFRRIAGNRAGSKILVLSHRNELVYQLERAFWPFLKPTQSTIVWNGNERPDDEVLQNTPAVFACVDSVFAAESRGSVLPNVDTVLVDECHHLGTEMYDAVLGGLGVGLPGGPFLLGLTATPWRPNGDGLDKYFAAPSISIDLVSGLRQGFLANVDYRMFTDNVDWEKLRRLQGRAFSPRGINRKLFIEEWDDAVVDRMAEAWGELEQPKAIVFCGTVFHAERVAARINALGFTRAAPIYSRSSKGEAMGIVRRTRIMWDFAEGKLGVLCAVDVLNEGVDVPDVNLVVFQRVTHSRRIFVQQLGRGLRLSPGKDAVIVLDFVSDVRRFAAGLDLQGSLKAPGIKAGETATVRLGSKVTFLRANNEDVQGTNFLREWLSDVEEIENAGEDASVLKFPPMELLPGGRH
jgi:superfamily II DNA or RNA helicase